MPEGALIYNSDTNETDILFKQNGTCNRQSVDLFGNIDFTQLDVNTLETLCAEVIKCIGADGDGIIDTLGVEAENVRNFCVEVIKCIDADGDGIMDTLGVEAENVRNFCVEVVDCIENNTDTQNAIQTLIEDSFNDAPQSLIDAIQAVIIDVFSQDPAVPELVEAVQCIISESIEPIDGDTCEELTQLFLGIGDDGKKVIRYADVDNATRIANISFDDDLNGNTTSYYGDTDMTGNPIFGDGVSTRPLGSSFGSGGDVASGNDFRAIINGVYDTGYRGVPYNMSDLPYNLVTFESNPITLACDTSIDVEIQQTIVLSDGSAPKTGTIYISWSDDGVNWFMRTVTNTNTPFQLSNFTDYNVSETDNGNIGNFGAGTWRFRFHITSNGAFLRPAGDPNNGGANGSAITVRLDKAVN